jgi:ribosomal protein S18 acetylase RimI-like enzyme
MRLQEVDSKKTRKAFLNFPKKLYKDDPNWICPLDNEIEGIFNPETNGKFKKGEAIRWVLFNDENVLIGRIAAFYDNHLISHYKYPTGGCGFFECIDNQQAANLLFDAAKEWLSERGMQAMQGPVNFGENYNYWGLLVDGFMKQGYAMPYNFPYYRALFENYGFQNYFEQYSYHNPVHTWPERMLKFAHFISTRPNYTFEHLSYDRLDAFVGYFVEIYNRIWSSFHENYTPLEDDTIRQMLLEAKPIMDEKLVWFAFDEGRPIGFLGVTPDVNQILAKLKNGKMNLLNTLKFIYYKNRAVTRSRVFVGGVHPDYQKSGVVGAMFLQLINQLKAKKGQVELELGWVGDYNKKMQSLYETIGVKKMKTHITYLKLFSPELQFERFSNEFEGKLYNK